MSGGRCTCGAPDWRRCRHVGRQLDAQAAAAPAPKRATRTPALKTGAMLAYMREGVARLGAPVPRKRGRPVDPNARRERTLIRSTPAELAAWTAAAARANRPLHTWLWEVANRAARRGS